RDTMLQALRCVIKPAGDKMSEDVRKSVVSTLTSLLNHEEDSTRLCAAGVLGVTISWLPPDELKAVVTQQLLDDNENNNWTIRHGRSAALFSSLKSAPSHVLNVANIDQV
ncbi:unnamed protein product, partial [Meganyctiphanes norvegica]